MRFHRAALALVSLSFLSSSLFAGSINLVANPGFDTNLNGWTSTSDQNGVSWVWNAQTAQLSSSSVAADVVLSQTVSGLTMGDQYVLSFDQTVGYGQIYWKFGTDEGLLFGSSHPSITVTATSASELLSFSGSVMAGALILDNVSVAAAAPAGGNSLGAPEPATWILMGSLVAIASRARRTRFGQISS